METTAYKEQKDKIQKAICELLNDISTLQNIMEATIDIAEDARSAKKAYTTLIQVHNSIERIDADSYPYTMNEIKTKL